MGAFEGIPVSSFLMTYIYNRKMNKLRIIFFVCLKSEVSVARFSICNVLENLLMHDEPILTCSNTNDAINPFPLQLEVHTDIKGRPLRRNTAKVFNIVVVRSTAVLVIHLLCHWYLTLASNECNDSSISK